MMRDAETPNFLGKLNQTTCHGRTFAHEFQGVTAHSLHYADQDFVVSRSYRQSN